MRQPRQIGLLGRVGSSLITVAMLCGSGHAVAETFPLQPHQAQFHPLPERLPATNPPDASAERIGQHVMRGFSLANRGAISSGREEFVLALELAAQAIDERQGTPGTAVQALANGLRALQEVDDFIPTPGQLAADLDLAIVVASHRCPALRQLDTSQMTPLTARSHYYAYAQTQLTAAVGQGRATSMALYGLGRCETALVAANRVPAAQGEPKAIALFQASLNVSAENFMAANELGVLLTRYGRLEHALSVFTYSVQLSPQVVTWQNLAIVHQRLGHQEAAQIAGVQAALAARQLAGTGAPTPGRPRVQWTKPVDFIGAGKPPAWK